MKRIISFCILFAISYHSYSQMLTIDQAIAYRTKSVSAFEELMSNKKWELLKIEKKSKGFYGLLSFVFNKNPIAGISESYIDFQFDDYDSNINRLIIQHYSTSNNATMISRIKKLGGKLIETNIEDKEILNSYQIGKSVVTVKTITDYDKYKKQVTYVLIFYSLTDFNNMKKDKELMSVEIDTTSATIEEFEREENSKQDSAYYFFKNADYKKCISIYLKIINTDKFTDEDYYYLGYSYKQLKQSKSAIKYFSLYYKNLPNSDKSTTVLNFLVELYYELDDLKSTIKYQLLLSELHGIAFYDCDLAWYFLLDKQYMKAADYISKAEESVFQHETNLFYLIQMNKAHIYLLSGKYETAKMLYLKYKGNIVNDEIWEDVVLKDFKIMKKFKILNPNIEKMANLLKR
jgi:TolA-binding protein